MLPLAEDLPGRFVKKGAAMGYVVDFSKAVVRVVVDQDSVDLIRNGTARVEARLASRLSEVLEAKVVREVPAASSELPSLALSTGGGGKIALDPEERNDRKPKAFRNYFLFDIALSGIDLNRVGERAFIRFVHPPETIAERCSRNVRRLVIRRFNL
jgi:putative peptide zinc metalloprotease protein